MSFDIEFDYRFASDSFFTEEVRAILDEAARLWGNVINDDFDTVPTGVEFNIENPMNGSAQETVTLTEPIDDLRIFAGANDLSGTTLGRGASRGRDVEGDIFRTRVADDFRGQGPVTDFEPFLGLLLLDTDQNWNFGLDEPAPDENDLLTVALHEIGHVLGLGATKRFEEIGAGGFFGGPNARSVNNGDPIPLTSDLAHTATSFQDGAPLIAPSISKGTRKGISDVDLALLADIGYEIDGFTAQGSAPAIADDGNNVTIRGTILDDSLDGLGGDDQIQGNAGDDTLSGSEGADVIFGEDGDDRLFGGPGDDQLQGGPGADLINGGPGADTLFGGGGADTFFIAQGDSATQISATIIDFTFGEDKILIDPDFGFANGAAVLDIAERSAANITDFTLATGTTLRVSHEPDASPNSTPVSESDIAIGKPDNLNNGQQNTPPVAADDIATVTAVGQSLQIDVLANDSDLDGDNLDITLSGQPDKGSAQTLTANGGPVVLYTPDQDFAGQDSFSYAVADGNGGSDTATVTLEDGTDQGGTGGDTPVPTDPADNLRLVIESDSPDDLMIQAGTVVKLLGDTSGHNVNIASGATALGIDAGTTVNLGLAQSAVTLIRDGTTLVVTDQNDNVVARVNASPAVESEIRFSDGGGALSVANGAMTFSGVGFNDGQSHAASNLGLDGTLTSGTALAGGETLTAPDATNLRILVQDDSPESLRVATGTNARFLGDTGDNTIDLANGAAAGNLKAGTTIDFDAPASDFAFLRDGTTMIAVNTDDNTAAQIAASPNATGSLRFNDGGSTVEVNSASIVFGGVAFGPLAEENSTVLLGSDMTLDPALTSDSNTSVALTGTSPVVTADSIV